MYLLRVTCAWSCSKATAWLSLSVFNSLTGFRKAEKQVPELCVRYWVMYLINKMYISTWILHKFNTINFTTCFDRKLHLSVFSSWKYYSFCISDFRTCFEDYYSFKTSIFCWVDIYQFELIDDVMKCSYLQHASGHSLWCHFTIWCYT